MTLLTGMLSSFVVSSFVPVFSLASLSSIAPCSSAVYSLLTAINSALASQPTVRPMVVPSLTALPLQKPLWLALATHQYLSNLFLKSWQESS